MIITEEITLSTRGFADIVNISPQIEAFAERWEKKEGQLTLFVPGSTAGVTTIEFEEGAIQDLKASIERLLPRDMTYDHDKRWGDGNGFAHVQAAWFGPSLTIPVAGGKPLLGNWQQVVIIDFDNRPRKRKIVLQFTG